MPFSPSSYNGPGIPSSNYPDLTNAPNYVGRRVATIGTSLVQQNNAGTTTPKISYWSRGWMPWARAYSKGAIYHPVWHDSTVIPGWEPSGTPNATRNYQGLNFGVSGQTTPQIIARLEYIKANYANAFDIIIVDGGTNDVASGNAALIQSQRETICDFFLAMGKIVILLPILARGTGSWAAGSTSRKTANFINSKTRRFARTRKNLFIWDWNQQWIDNSAADSVPLTGSSSDEIHYNVKGGDDNGYDLWRFLSAAGIIPPATPKVWAQDDLYDATSNPEGNVLTNPFCLGTSGANGTASSGSVATGMRSERSSGSACSVVCTKEVRADNRGEWQVLTYDIVGTTEELFYFRTSTADTTHAHAGQWVRASIEVETNDTDGLTGLSLYLTDQNGTNGLLSYDLEPFDNGSGNERWPAKNRSILLETNPILMAADSTTARWRLEVRVKGPSLVPPIIKAGAIEFRRISDPRVFV